jgi:hypothetical protein
MEAETQKEEGIGGFKGKKKRRRSKKLRVGKGRSAEEGSRRI